MAVVDHVLIVVLLATVLPVAVNASPGIISIIGLAPRVLRNVHSAKVFTTVLCKMKRLMKTIELLVFMLCRFYLSFDEKQTKIFLLIDLIKCN